jgi:bifunctional non-homologous end joining protein LigD
VRFRLPVAYTGRGFFRSGAGADWVGWECPAGVAYAVLLLHYLAQPMKPTDLSRYRKKRDPSRTVEPFGTEGPSRAGGTWVGQFVVHLHAARAQHFDLRLESGGALLSFAVPRGPSLDPADKRLAVQTEPHPLEYAEFEDVIAPGNYGAGSMIVWDQGTVRYRGMPAEEGDAAGKLDFVLEGLKLRGRFELVLTRREGSAGQRQWLWFKQRDVHAVSAPPQTIAEAEPRSVLSHLTVAELADKSKFAAKWLEQGRALSAPERPIDIAQTMPMLCVNEGARLKDPERLYEFKLDGVRLLADSSTTLMRYRSGLQVADRFPELVRALRALPPVRLVLDGEIVALDPQGKPSFERLGHRLHARTAADVQRARVETPVQLVVFDLLQIGPYSLLEQPLERRKELLSSLIVGRGLIWVLEHQVGDGSALFDFCQAQGLEGVVAKKRLGVYRPGPKRSGDWVKIKCRRRADFVVAAVHADGGSKSRIGALELVTRTSPDADGWTYRGRVGSGISERGSAELYEKLKDATPPPVVQGLQQLAPGGRWVVPEVVVNVEYLEWTNQGRLRMPVYCGPNPVLTPEQCFAAPPAAFSDGTDAEGDDSQFRSFEDAEGSETAHSAAAEAHDEAEAEPDETEFAGDDAAEAAAASAPQGLRAAPGGALRVNITRRNKVFWPDEGYTKGDLIDYYTAVAPVLVPYLVDRPLVLVRYPDGVAGKNFFQWNVPAHTPSWVGRFELEPSSPGKESKIAFLVENVEGLQVLINLGCIPLHVLALRRDTPEACDFITLDFDLGPRPLADAVRLVLDLKALLTELGVRGFVKTSGQTGLHVLIPLGPGVPFEAAKALVELLGRLLQRRNPTECTLQRRVDERGDRIYVDTGQTGRRRTIVAPYSVRAVAGATVSTPLSWDEVHLALEPRRYSLKTVPLRLERMSDPMAPLLQERLDLPQVIAKLGQLLAIPAP